MMMTTSAEIRERLAYGCGLDLDVRAQWDRELAEVRRHRVSRRSETERAKLGVRSLALDLGVLRPRVLELVWFKGFGAHNVSVKWNGRMLIKAAVCL